MSNAPTIIAVDRRTTLRWFVAAAAAGQLAACGEQAKGLSWPEVTAIKAKGIGKDPVLDPAVVPWPLTLSRAELLAAAALADVILPAEGEAPSASAVGVPAFIDEWVSAPYPSQHADRQLIIPGLAWLDDESRMRNKAPFAVADEAGRKAIVDDIAWSGRVKAGLEKHAQFFGRMRALTLGAYFTSREGWKDIGYLGNTPVASGPYPGPTPEAIEHIKGVLDGMGLKLVFPDNGKL
jgi:hypothetical protein